MKSTEVNYKLLDSRSMFSFTIISPISYKIAQTCVDWEDEGIGLPLEVNWHNVQKGKQNLAHKTAYYIEGIPSLSHNLSPFHSL